jgi:hypothetical protein
MNMNLIFLAEMCKMAKPFMSTTYAGFPDLLVNRVKHLKNLEEGPVGDASARHLLRANGVSVLNFGNPWTGDVAPDEAIINEMCDTLGLWA